MQPTLFSQLPSPPAGSIEAWLLSAAAVGSIAVIAKKLFSRKPPGHAEFATRSELHHELSAVRDRIDARFLDLAQKLDHHNAAIHERLNHLDAGLARVDERTKNS